MPGQPFFFKLEFASEGVSDALLEELASQLLRHLGRSPRQAPDLDAALTQAAATAKAAGRCDLEFRLEDGALEITVSSDRGRLLQSSHPIPDRS